MSEPFERFLCVSVDAQGYSRRHDRDQFTLQADLLRVLAEAATVAGLDRESWLRQGSGDGELALVPSGSPEAPVIDEFVRAIGTLLSGHNQDRRPDDRLRLRLAADHGPVDSAANGFAGRAVVAVSRLVNSGLLRRALATSHADLAVLLSDRIYTDLVLGGHTSLSPSDLRKVSVREKEFRESAWLLVPSVDVHALDLGVADGSRIDPPHSTSGRDQTATTEISGWVNAPGATFGIRNG